MTTSYIWVADAELETATSAFERCSIPYVKTILPDGYMIGFESDANEGASRLDGMLPNIGIRTVPMYEVRIEDVKRVLKVE